MDSAFLNTSNNYLDERHKAPGAAKIGMCVIYYALSTYPSR